MTDELSRLRTENAALKSEVNSRGAHIIAYREDLERAEAQLAKMRVGLKDVLARDAEWAPSGAPNDCNCINLSRDGEREYETGTCPHQRARALLSTPPAKPARYIEPDGSYSDRPPIRPRDYVGRGVSAEPLVAGDAPLPDGLRGIAATLGLPSKALPMSEAHSAATAQPTIWQQERPEWCPHQDCAFKARSQDSICIGELPKARLHGEIPNTHRLCQRGAPDDGAWLHQVEWNKGDAWNLRRCLDAAFPFSDQLRAERDRLAELLREARQFVNDAGDDPNPDACDLVERIDAALGKGGA